MDEDVARRAMAIFKSIVDLDRADRGAAIEKACGQDATLLSRVKSLIGALDETGGFLETPAMGFRAPKPDQIPGYRIVRELGAGGMATVYEAIQERPNRRVALKVMKHGIQSPTLLRRFEFETEVLARLQHPSIASIYDVGSFHNGRDRVPFFALEFVENARSITSFANEKALSLVQRVEMFVQVCDAVEHGHRKGVIHRDLKPGNILVDETGRPRVIDFGIARSKDATGDSITAHTDLYAVLGTLNYMSPEQCSGATRDLDGRSDVYSLGVILYELLCGSLPHELTRISIPEALRTIQERNPTRPSVLNPDLRGDLETILLRALDKDRDRRYPTAGSLGQDLQRWSRFEAIEARPPTMRYQVKLFVRRHRAAVAFAMLAIGAMVASTLLSLFFGIRARHEASQRALAEATAIEQRDAALEQAYSANIAAAIAAYETGEYGRMRSRLSAAPSHLRGWEWLMLSGLSEPSVGVVSAHDAMIDSMSAAEGKLLVTGAKDGVVRTWNAGDASPIASIEAHSGEVRAVAAFPDGRRVASAGTDGMLCVWDAESGALIREIVSEGSAIHGLAIRNDHVVAAADRSGRLRSWDVETGEPSGPVIEQPGGVRAAVYADEGRMLVTWGRRADIWIRNPDEGSVIRQIQADGDVLWVALSSDVRRLAAGGEDGIIWIWDVSTGELVHTLTSDWGIVRSIAFSPDGSTLAVGHGSSRVIVLWDLASGTSRAVLRGHEETVTGVAFSKDGSRLYSASWDRTIREWDIVNPDSTLTLRGHAGWVLRAVMSGDGRLVVSVGADETVRFWDAVLGEPIAVADMRGRAPSRLAIAPDGRTLAVNQRDRSVLLIDLFTGKTLRALDGGQATAQDLEFSPDGALLASASDGIAVTIWSLADGTRLHTLSGHSARVNAVAFNLDGTLLCTGSRDHNVCVWNARTGELLHTLTGHESDVFDVVFSIDGRRVYSGGRDQTIREWDVATGQCMHVYSGHGQLITSLSPSPDQSRLAAGSWFDEIVLLNLVRAEVVSAFKAHDGAVREVQFQADGRRLMSASYDGTIRLWDTSDLDQRRDDIEQARRSDAQVESALAGIEAQGTTVSLKELEQQLQTDLHPSLKASLRKALLHRAFSPGAADQSDSSAHPRTP